MVHVICKNKKGKETPKLYFSTDLLLEALDYYTCRFQIELLNWDTKQHTALNDCQVRSNNKLHFHFDAALTRVNVAKIQHRLSLPK